ncbi:MAG: hypothetical protein EOQ65_28595 [Mesorhizobium sp.]|uniref:hypothetical protein n=1 Tax=Mesorhizobium sp. TaxID=1871066 RepID=UPI000FE7E0CB|nr:hypothetical protein [Mesorhizobium sp.]RWG55014.1 MAG: hypothetical protein EOQ65_28595 [Mesorhizobium sp.]
MKADAQKYRIGENLPPAAPPRSRSTTARSSPRFLTACAPTPANDMAVFREIPAPARVFDDAFVASDLDIPKFLRESWARLMAGKGE